MSGNVTLDPGLVLANSVDAWTVWVEPAAKGLMVVSSKVNFDPGVFVRGDVEVILTKF